jgi:hypothetical protein
VGKSLLGKLDELLGGDHTTVWVQAQTRSKTA